MNTKILSKDKDPMGAAILDYQKSGSAGRLRVLSSMFEEDEMPVKHLFRKVEEMPMLEQKALQLTKGRVLDIGAGSGCHTLALQEKGLEVKAIDISPLSCEAMELRGVMDAECINLFDEHLEKIRQVMRFSGPRMLFSHPLMAIRHMIETQREKQRQKQGG